MKSSLVLILTILLSVPSQAQRLFTLNFSTFVEGSNYDQVRDVATDSAGNIYVTGGTSSKDFIVTSGERLHSKGQKTMDIFLRKYAPDGNMIWSVLLGGNAYDRAYAVEVDGTGNIYIAGRAGKGLPVTKSAFQTIFGDDENPNPLYGKQDGFIAKYSADGKMIWCSYFGGADRGFIRDLALDKEGNICIIETETSALNPHISSDAIQKQNRGGYDAVVSKISNDGKSVIWATWIGGTKDDFFGPSIKVNSLGEIVVAGTVFSPDLPTTSGCLDSTLNGESDIFIVRYNPEGTRLLSATYFGGNGMEGTETHNLALDKWDNIIIAASTSSEDLTVSENALQPIYGGDGGIGTGKYTNYPHDGFVTKISNTGNKILASTYFGGKLGEAAEGVGVDEKGNIYITGATFSGDLSIQTSDSYQKVNAGAADAFFACFNPSLSKVIYFSFLGAMNMDYGRSLCVDHTGFIHITGETSSPLFPSPDASFGGGAIDGFLATFKPLD